MNVAVDNRVSACGYCPIAVVGNPYSDKAFVPATQGNPLAGYPREALTPLGRGAIFRLPLSARLSGGPLAGVRKIVLATNVAETCASPTRPAANPAVTI
jgi:hypothetical protein